jgi:ABC-type polysaccharide/polyol phosphate export permease
MALISGTKPSIYWLQLPVCLAMLILFIFMWSFMFGLMNIMSPDILDFIKTIKPAFFWLSGILFNIRGRGSILFKLNPICFLVENYRNALCFDTWFWEDRTALLCFFGIIFIMLMITWLLYRKIGNLLAELV